MISACFDYMASGVRCRFLLKFFIGLTDNKIVYLMHIGIIIIFLPQFWMDGLIHIILLVVGNPRISFGVLGSSVRHYGWHIRFGKGHRYLGHNRRVTAITIRFYKITFQFLHFIGELIQGSQPEIEDASFQVTAFNLEVGIAFGILTLCFLSPCLLFPLTFLIGGLYLTLLSQSLWIAPLRGSGWFVFDHLLTFLILLC